jgi:putative intracellular protease/amidase
MSKKVLILASNLGLWGEELQAPWDALKSAGHELVLATPKGMTPLPLELSMNKDFVDPMQNYHVNPSEVVDRINQVLDAGEWDNPIKIEDATIEGFDALVLVGGPGSPLDIVGNPYVHQLCVDAYNQGKLLGALCYAVGAFVWARDTDTLHRSIIYGKKIVAHPREWDFTGPMNYPLVRVTSENAGTNLVTQGFVFPLQVIVEDAVGPLGRVYSDPTTNREKPQVMYDYPFVTALSVESSIAFGNKLVEALASQDQVAAVHSSHLAETSSPVL